MSTKLTLEECETIARKIWYGQDRWGFYKMPGYKWAQMPSLGISGMTVDFPFPSGTWTPVGIYEMSISYPKWDFPGQIDVRKHK